MKKHSFPRATHFEPLFVEFQLCSRERAQKVYGFLVDNRDKVCNSVAGSQSETQKLAKTILKIVLERHVTLSILLICLLNLTLAPKTHSAVIRYFR